MATLLKFCNDNHWFLIGGACIAAMTFWIYGCQSTVTSMIDPNQKINREQLQLETDYIIGQAKVKLQDLDRQDELKQLILDQAAIFGTTGTFNPMGLLNTLISIGAISFGLNRNQKLNALQKNTTTGSIA